VTTWTSQELDRIGQAEELQLATRRHRGGVSRYVTIWVVRAGDALYVRSANGPDKSVVPARPGREGRPDPGRGASNAPSASRPLTPPSRVPSTPPTTPNTAGTDPGSSALSRDPESVT